MTGRSQEVFHSGRSMAARRTYHKQFQKFLTPYCPVCIYGGPDASYLPSRRALYCPCPWPCSAVVAQIEPVLANDAVLDLRLNSVLESQVLGLGLDLEACVFVNITGFGTQCVLRKIHYKNKRNLPAGALSQTLDFEKNFATAHRPSQLLSTTDRTTTSLVHHTQRPSAL